MVSVPSGYSALPSSAHAVGEMRLQVVHVGIIKSHRGKKRREHHQDDNPGPYLTGWQADISAPVSCCDSM